CARSGIYYYGEDAMDYW
nr:immunoglobulin heavy chain junction region [Mus musculus]